MTLPSALRAATLATAVSLLPTPGRAQLSEPAGASGYKLLKLDLSPRASALSGAGVALPGSDQGTSPALEGGERILLSAGWTSGYSRFESQIEHTEWIVPTSAGALFGRMRFQGFRGLEGYDAEDRPTGTYTASTWSAGAGFSPRLETFVPGLAAGLALHGGMNHVASIASFAGWGDLGARWTTGDLALGGAVRNWGLASRSDRDPETLPLQFQFGGAFSHALPFDWNLAVLADARYTIDESWTLPVGLESRRGMLFLRTGWNLGMDESRPSFGVGVQGESWAVDASLGWHGALGLSPGMSVSAGI